MLVVVPQLLFTRSIPLSPSEYVGHVAMFLKCNQGLPPSCDSSWLDCSLVPLSEMQPHKAAVMVFFNFLKWGAPSMAQHPTAFITRYLSDSSVLLPPLPPRSTPELLWCNKPHSSLCRPSFYPRQEWHFSNEGKISLGGILITVCNRIFFPILLPLQWLYTKGICSHIFVNNQRKFWFTELFHDLVL